MLTVLTASGFVYCSDIVLLDDGGPPAIWNTDNIQYAVIAVLRFLAADRDGVAGVTCMNLRMDCSSRRFHIAMPSGGCHELDDIGLLAVLHGSCFDPVALLIAYSTPS